MVCQKRNQILTYIAVSILVTGCGGGGSSPAPVVVPPATNTTVWQDNAANTTDMVWSDGSGQNKMKWSD